ncbi:hypothetical protein [Duganella vulcania]|uniref:Uncharacterized protein n=1 Tax=Duganella vulcania TaxID=2692166 RepID=A0A845GNW9_9BURK|nr:hypothetical protein [Duganella vulcania]MYM96233.1 hypothetical protein [Duganella vulcania]
MRYPNLRYGNPTEFAYYVMCHGDDIARVARILRRSERSVKDWLHQRKKIPWWVPEVLRLQRMEAAHTLRQMGINPRPSFGLVTHQAQLVLRRPETKTPQVTDLRRAAFDQPAKAISS